MIIAMWWHKWSSGRLPNPKKKSQKNTFCVFCHPSIKAWLPEGILSPMIFNSNAAQNDSYAQHSNRKSSKTRTLAIIKGILSFIKQERMAGQMKAVKRDKGARMIEKDLGKG
jgi:hypothetical protein